MREGKYSISTLPPLTSSSACDLVDNINSTNVNVIDVIAQV